MSGSVFNIYKPLGLTPLQAVEYFRLSRHMPPSLKITYAGRLDPMAEGVLLALTGEAIREKEKYLALPKTYTAKVLLGFETDTYDTLGMATRSTPMIINRESLALTIKTLQGNINLELPVYSSVPVKGKPLFMWAREERLNEIKVPTREMDIKNIKLIKFSSRSAKKVKDTIIKNISKVDGDFRQKEIVKKWKQVLAKNDKLQIATIEVSCGSGTYIRSLSHYLGKQLGTHAVLFHLLRNNVGRFDHKKSLKLPSRRSPS